MSATKSKTTAKSKNSKATKPAKAKTTKPTAKADAKKLSQIEAAVTVLTKASGPMNCKAMVEAMTKQGVWASPGGATPEATLYSSNLREINTKGKDARFKKVERGQFALVGTSRSPAIPPERTRGRPTRSRVTVQP